MTMTQHTIEFEDVARLVRKQLGAKLPADSVLTPDSAFKDLHLSSLDQTEVFFALEELIGLELEPERAAEVATIGGLTEVIGAMIAEHEAVPSPATTG
jgi:acyl carrier protein